LSPEECFENNKLKFENGLEEVQLESGTKDGEDIKKKNFYFKVQLPKDLTCQHCVFQWWWLGVNQEYVCKYFLTLSFVCVNMKIKLIL